MGRDSVQRTPNGSRQDWIKGLPILGAIWLAGAVSDRLWFALDRSVPSWDPADYLAGALIYWQALQVPHWFSGEWWISLWQLSTKIPPLVYISTVPWLNLFGLGAHQSTLVFLMYSGILLGSVSLLATYLFSSRVGLWAAAICVLLPTLYQSRLVFILDYPLTAMVTLCFLCLTLWRGQKPLTDTKPEEGVAKAPDIFSPDVFSPDIFSKDIFSKDNSEDQTQLAVAKELEPSSEDPAKKFIDSPSLPSPLPLSPSPHTPHPIPHTRIPPFLLPWLLAALTGITLGLGLMTKQTTILFMLVPLVWVLGELGWRRDWEKLAQWVFALAMSLPVWLPWYRTNWLLILTSSKRATIDSAIAEGALPMWSLRAWLLYLWELPGMVTLPLLLVPMVGLMFFWRRSRVSCQHSSDLDYAPKPRAYRHQAYQASRQALGWLLVFLVGGYVLSSLNPNKDPRYVAPYLPVLAIILGYGFTLLPRSWRLLQWGTLALATILMVGTLFPVFAGQENLSRRYPSMHFPYQGVEYPHAQVIAEVIQTAPFLQSTIGVLPSTPEINQHNVNYFGMLRNFQVYGRQVGSRKAFVEQDGRSLDWFLSKTGSQGAIRGTEAQTAIVQAVETGSEFELRKTWNLPDDSLLKLYHRKLTMVDVTLLEQKKSGASSAPSAPIPDSPESEKSAPGSPPIQLTKVTVPAQVPPGQPVPVTYEWVGSGDRLNAGLMLLTWRRQGETGITSDRWFHDHAIAMGMLFAPAKSTHATAHFSTAHFQVIERLAMLPPADVATAAYTLEARYLDRKTGKASAIAVPPVTLRIAPEAAAKAAPELDLVTQLDGLAAILPQGTPALTQVSNEISRINQYDPVQDYLSQAQQAAAYRLQEEPSNSQLAYTVALANVLKRQVNPAIAALQKVTQLDAQNPYAYAYLAFVNLYDFRPQAAQAALNQALKLSPKLPELHALTGIASLMQGNLVKAWNSAQTYQQQEAKRQREKG